MAFDQIAPPPADIFDGYSATDEPAAEAQPSEAPVAAQAAPVTPTATPTAQPEETPVLDDESSVEAETAKAGEPAAEADDDPWKALEQTIEAPAADAGSVASEALSAIAKQFGIEQAPASVEELAQTVAAQVEQQVQQQLAVLAQPELIQYDRMIAMEDFDLVTAYKKAISASRKDSDILPESDESIEAAVILMEEKGTLGPEAIRIREHLTSRKAQRITEEQQRQAAALAEEAAETKRIADGIALVHEEFRKTAAAAKDPMGKPLGTVIGNTLAQYINSGEYMRDINYGPTPEIRAMADGPERQTALYEWHVANAARIHKLTAKTYREQEAQRLRMSGQSELLREMERQQPIIGNGFADTNTSNVVTAADFFPN